MGHTSHAKHERVIEGVRRGLEGEALLEFIHSSGFALTEAGLLKALQGLGGRAGLTAQLAAGKSNYEILRERFPLADLSEVHYEAPAQPELFHDEADKHADAGPAHAPEFETTKLMLALPTDLYAAIGLAARAEGKRRNDLIVDILTRALSSLP